MEISETVQNNKIRQIVKDSQPNYWQLSVCLVDKNRWNCERKHSTAFTKPFDGTFFPPNTAPFRHVVIFPEYEIFFVFISSCYFNSTLFIVKYKNLSFIQHKNSNKYQSLIDFSLLFLFQGFFQTKIFSKLLLLFKNLYNHQCSNRISSFIESLIKSINDSTFNLIY